MFFLLFLIIGLYFLIHLVIAQIFIAAAELAISTGIPTNEAKAEIETHPLTAEAKITKFSVQFKILQIFSCFLLISSFCFISSVK